MDSIRTQAGHPADMVKRLGQRLLSIGENRLELLLVEAQKEREQLVQALLLLVGAAVCGSLAGATLTGAAVVLLWEYSRVAALLGVATVWAGASLWSGWRLARLLNEWRHFSATIDQLRKDRACLEEHLIRGR